jgi:hypothetical protein
MTEQEIKAWSMAIAAALYRPEPGTEQVFNAEFMDWLTTTAKLIADEIRKTPSN